MEDQKMMLQEAGILQSDGHFIGTSGEHLSHYLDFDLIYEPRNEGLKSKLLTDLAEKIKSTGTEVMTGPAEGGNVLSLSLAHYLPNISVAINKKSDGTFIYEPQELEKLRHKKVIVVDDVFQTGYSLRKLDGVLQGYGIRPVAFAVILNRHSAQLREVNTLPLLSVLSFPLSSWNEVSCPLCMKNIPVNTDFGHGQEFLDRKR